MALFRKCRIAGWDQILLLDWIHILDSKYQILKNVFYPMFEIRINLLPEDPHHSYVYESE